jgi:FkbM family methyltransferase
MSEKFVEWVDKFKIKPVGLIHVGAHLVQERDVYRNLGFEPVIWVEASPIISAAAEKILKNYPNQRIINKAMWSKPGVEKIFYIAGRENSSSSLLEPYLIEASHPDVYTKDKVKVMTSTLDIELSDLEINLNFLVLDVQGAELEVLKGSIRTLEKIDYVIAELSAIELYRNNARMSSVILFLKNHNFIYVSSEINRATGWGEGLFIKKTKFNLDKEIKVSHKVVGKRFAKGRVFRTALLRLKTLKIN